MHNRATHPVLIHLLAGFMTGTCFALFTHYHLYHPLGYVWLGFYCIMFLLAYEGHQSIKQLIIITLIPSLLASIPFVWPNARAAGQFPVMAVISAYALNAFHITYQKHRFHWPYATLFYAVWDTFVKLFIVSLFAFICWGILLLWAFLFTLIHISFFKTLFDKTWFMSWSWPFFLAVGFYITHVTTNVVRNLRWVLMMFCRYLLPVLALIALFFIISGVISITLYHHKIHLNMHVFLTISLLSVIFINGVYQDGHHKQPYPAAIQILVTTFLIITPLFSLLALYALFFDASSGAIFKHGLHADTFLTLLNTGLLLCYNLCYALIATLKQTPWLRLLKKFNIILAIVVIAITLIANNHWLNNSSFNPGRLTPVNFFASNDSKMATQKLFQQFNKKFKNSHFSWQKKGMASPLVLGFNQHAINLCRSRIKNHYFAGTIHKKQCQFIYNHKIYTRSNYTVLHGPQDNVLWKGWVNTSLNNKEFPIAINDANGKITYIIRVIYQNRIHVGTAVTYHYAIIVNNHIHSVNYVQYFHIKPQ